jgi:hypothetical protein
MSYEPDPYGPETSNAAAKTNVPGILLLVTGVLNILGALYYMVNGFVTLANPEAAMQMAKSINPNQPADPGMYRGIAIGYIALGIVALLCAVVMIIGGLKMRALTAHGLALFAAVLALVPCISPTACCALGVVSGIWALVVLANPEVKSAFR